MKSNCRIWISIRASRSAGSVCGTGVPPVNRHGQDGRATFVLRVLLGIMFQGEAPLQFQADLAPLWSS